MSLIRKAVSRAGLEFRELNFNPWLREKCYIVAKERERERETQDAQPFNPMRKLLF